MAQFKAYSDGVEVNGETVLSVLEAMSVFRAQAEKILEENGLINPEPGKWYNQQAWLNAFKYIADEIGPNTLYSIGRKVPESAQFPADIDSIEKALGAIDVAYNMNHRGGKIGHYSFELTGLKSAKITCNNPYPCDFDNGIIESMAKKFQPADSIMVMVSHDTTASCRKNGADSCIYKISW
ncbi:MAG: hypothetical protein OEM02_02825 [Desulfobulbaceae bacterium]|nr:hypothetical protein [Desulfobulbaceae bacterium]